MKTKVEVLGYEIEIEEADGVVTVKAELDGDVVEEFTLETPGDDSQGQSQDDNEEIKGFGDFDGEEESDFDDDNDDDDDDDDIQGQSQPQSQNDDEEVKLESFQSFFNKRK